MDWVARQDVADGLTSLDAYLAEVFFEDDFADARVGFQRHLDDFGFTVGVGAEVGDLGFGCALRHVVLAVADDGRHGKALDVGRPVLAVAVAHVVDGALVVLLENVGVEDVLAHELLVGHGRDEVAAVAEEEDDVVQVRAVGQEFVLLQAGADEAFLAVDVELLVGLDDLGGVDGVEVAQLRAAGEVLAVLLLEHTEPVDGIFHEVGQVAFGLLDVGLHAGYLLFGLVGVELQDAGHLDFHQAEDVVLRHFADELRVVGRQAQVDVFAGCVHVAGLFEFLVLIDAFFDEYLFERGEVQAFAHLVAVDFQFAAQQVAGVVDGLAQDVAHGEEVGLALVDDAAVGRDAHLAVGEGVEGVDGLVRRRARRQVHQYLDAARCQVLHLAYLDFAFLAGLHDGVAHAGHGLAVGDFADDQRLVVYLLDARTDANRTAAFAVVVLRHVDAAPRLEVGVEAEVLAVQVADGGVAQLVEVVGQDFGRQADGNAFHALGQQQGELDGQGDRFAVAAVVGQLPFRRLGVEHHVEGKP